MSKKQFGWCGLVMCIGVIVGAVVGTPQALPETTEQKEIWKTLDALHKAASEADGEAYFDLFAPNAVFLGTDATERWTIDEFRDYAMKRFESGSGWIYTLKPGTRYIVVDGDIAWFDELLENEKYGTCRGSGVLRRIDDKWLIEQYVLSFTVPNEVALDVVAITRQADD